MAENFGFSLAKEVSANQKAWTRFEIGSIQIGWKIKLFIGQVTVSQSETVVQNDLQWYNFVEFHT